MLPKKSMIVLVFIVFSLAMATCRPAPPPNAPEGATTTKSVIEAQNSNKNFRQVHDKKGKGATCTDSGIIMHANQY